MRDIALIAILVYLAYHSFDMIEYSSFFGKKYSTIIHVILGFVWVAFLILVAVELL